MSETNWPRLRESNNRVEQFKRELETADPTSRANLLNSWKEEIIHNLIECVNVTENSDTLASLDRNIAVAFDIHLTTTALDAAKTALAKKESI